MAAGDRKARETQRRLEFGHAILEYRRMMMLSQTELAQQIGIKRNTLSQWERAGAFPQPYHMRALMNAEKLAPDFKEDLKAIYESVPWMASTGGRVFI